MKNKALAVKLLFLIMVNISGCTGSALLGSLTTNTASASSSLSFPDTYKKNIINIACEVGTDMGYEVLAQKDNIAVLKVSTANDIISDIAGAKRNTEIFIGQMDNKLSIIVTDNAYYGLAEQKYCEEIINKFSERLSMRLN